MSCSGEGTDDVDGVMVTCSGVDVDINDVVGVGDEETETNIDKSSSAMKTDVVLLQGKWNYPVVSY